MNYAVFPFGAPNGPETLVPALETEVPVAPRPLQALGQLVDLERQHEATREQLTATLERNRDEFVDLMDNTAGRIGAMQEVHALEGTIRTLGHQIDQLQEPAAEGAAILGGSALRAANVTIVPLIS